MGIMDEIRNGIFNLYEEKKVVTSELMIDSMIRSCYEQIYYSQDYWEFLICTSPKVRWYVIPKSSNLTCFLSKLRSCNVRSIALQINK